MSNITVDFVAFDDDRDACLLVLVVEGWGECVEDHLSLLQERFYGCMNAALDGQVADLFPKSQAPTIVIQVDCYDLPVEPIDDFVRRFSSGVFEMSDYSPEGSPFVRAFQFEVNHLELPA
jgi:hypothetical protein